MTMKMSIRVTNKAKAIALSQGHKDPDEISVCTDGAKVPVWRFYYEAAKLQVRGCKIAGYRTGALALLSREL
jgi:hypothetical protein